MNKAKAKFLTECAKLLPAITEKRSGFVMQMGRDLPKEMTQDDAGKPINPNKRYKCQTVETIPVDHLKKLKAVYNTGGLPAVKHYTEAVQDLFEASQKKQAVPTDSQTEVREKGAN